MSVRPITVGEETKAYAHPWVNIFSLFGATQGVLIYLHRLRIPVTSNWFAAGAGSLPLFLALGLGGYVVGGGVAMAAFADWPLLRLAQSHQADRALLTDSQSAKSLTF